MIGEVVGGYLVERKLGEGGMGEVYLATHRRISKRVAIKVLQPEISRQPEMLNRFFNEARATSVIEHPNIVEVLDCDFHASGRAFIVMEFLRGETLASALFRVGSLNNDLGAVCALIRQISSAVDAAHGKGIVHRDLKPDNIFLVRAPYGSSAPLVKVLDFGIAKLAASASDNVSRTRTGSLLGTPLYMSPEQCRGASEVDHRADIYSLGCVLFEMLSGRPPFQKAGAGDLIMAQMTEPPPSMSSLGVSVPPALEDLTQRMLAKKPEWRPASMNEITVAIEAIAAGLGAPPCLLTVAEPTDLPPVAMTPGGYLNAPPTPAGYAPRTPVALTPGGMAGGTALLPNPGSNDETQRSDANRRAVHPTQPMTPPPSSGGTTLGDSTGQFEPRRGRTRPEALRMTPMPAPPEKKTSPLVWVLGTMVVVGGLVGGVLWRLDAGHDLPPRPRAMIERAATTSTGEATTGKSTAASADDDKAPGARVTIDVREAPEGLTATVDGRPTAFPVSLFRDARSHDFVFSAPGRRDVRMSLDATRDQSLVLAMQPAEPEPAPDKAINDQPARQPPEHRHRDNHHAERQPKKPRGGAPETSGTPSSPSPPRVTEPAQPKPATPARRLPAVITDID